MLGMIVIGADTHKQTHTLVACDEATGRHLGEITVSSKPEGALDALTWAARLGDDERVWAIEGVRHVSGRLERELIRHGQAVIRVPPRLMAGARPAGRLRGKSDPIDAAAVALAGIRAGLGTLPVARLEGVDLELRRLLDRREDLVQERTPEINRLRWALHDMHCPIEVPARAMDQIGWSTRLMGWTQRQHSVQGRIAHDTLLRVRALTRDISAYERELDTLARQHAGELIDNVVGCGSLTAAKIVGETAGIDRFRSEACYARSAGTAPVPVPAGAPAVSDWTAAATASSTSPFTASRSTKPASVPKPAATSNASRPRARPAAKRSAVSSATSPGASTTS
jgi:transposase